MNSIALIATEWYWIVIKYACLAATVRWCASLDFTRSSLLQETVETNRTVRQEVVKNFLEFLLSLTVWILTARYWASSFDDRFGTGFGFGDWTDAVFVIGTGLTAILPFYACVWIWGFTLKSSQTLALDARSRHEDHTLYILAERLGIVRILTIFAKWSGFLWVITTVAKITRRICCLIHMIVDGYRRYYRNKANRARA